MGLTHLPREVEGKYQTAPLQTLSRGKLDPAVVLGNYFHDDWHSKSGAFTTWLGCKKWVQIFSHGGPRERLVRCPESID